MPAKGYNDAGNTACATEADCLYSALSLSCYTISEAGAAATKAVCLPNIMAAKLTTINGPS